MAKRSDVITEFPKFIKAMRENTELRCPDFCRRLRIDDAGEWGSQYENWKRVCTELEI